MGENEYEQDMRLMACPFCGSATAPHAVRWWNEREGCYDNHQWQVVCHFGAGGCGSSSGYRASERAAIELWNRRASE